MIWLAAVLAGPLLLLFAYSWEVRIANGTRGHLACGLNVEHLVSTARITLNENGFDTTGWKPRTRLNDRGNRLRYYLAQRSKLPPELMEIFPPYTIRVQFQSPDSKQFASVALAPDGRVLALDPPDHDLDWDTTTLTDADRQAAAAALRKMQPEALPVDWGVPTVQVARQGSGEWRRYRWKANPKGHPDLTLNAQADLLQGQMKASRLDSTVSRKFDRNSALGDAGTPFYFLGAACFLIVLFIRRALQQEIPYRRLGLIVGIAYSIFLLFVFSGAMKLNINNESRDILESPTVLVFVCLILLPFFGIIGLWYAAIEELVRERYPAKLTSLDALLCGGVTSWNVSRSIWIGISIAGWLYLAQVAVFSLQPYPAMDHAVVRAIGAVLEEMPLLQLLALTAVLLLALPVFGLLPPLLLRNYRPLNSRFAPVWLFLAALAGLLLSQLTIVNRPTSFWMEVLQAAPAAALLLLVFAWQDALALLACVGTVIAANNASALTVAADFNWLEPTRLALPLAAIYGLATLGLLKGRRYTMEQVRPQYAAHIAERISLQSELTAAREAQMRLLPDATPALPGVSMAATCIPARTVTGDFYEFFPAGEGRTGILMLDASGSELASALVIAFAKGYLMQKAESAASPSEIVRCLARELSQRLLEGQDSPDLCYLLVDSRRNRIEYARLGEAARLVVCHRDGAIYAENALHGAITSGEIALAPGEHIFLCSRGLVHLIHQRTRHSAERWLSQQIHHSEQESAEHLQQRLLTRLFARDRLFRRATLIEDVTLVTISADSVRTLSLVEVA